MSPGRWVVKALVLQWRNAIRLRTGLHGWRLAVVLSGAGAVAWNVGITGGRRSTVTMAFDATVAVVTMVGALALGGWAVPLAAVLSGSLPDPVAFVAACALSSLVGLVVTVACWRWAETLTELATRGNGSAARSAAVNARRPVGMTSVGFHWGRVPDGLPLSGQMAALAMAEVMSTLRHPVVVANVVLFLVLVPAAALLPEMARLSVGPLLAMVLACLLAVLSESSYGRSLSTQWMSRSTTRTRGAWILPQLAATAVLTLPLAMIAPLVISHGSASGPVYASTLLTVLVAGSNGWLGGVLVPYSDSSPGSMWISTSVAIFLTGLWGFVGDNAGWFEQPPLFALAAICWAAVAVMAGSVIGRSREALRA